MEEFGDEPLYVLESKKKCFESDMDPNEIIKLKVIMSKLELANKRKKYEEILQVVNYFSKKLLNSLKDTPILIGVSDEKGFLLDMTGDESIQSTLNQLGIKVGAQFTHEDMGTNVVSLTLQQNHPVQLIGTNHYHTSLHNIACYGVPFHYTDVNHLLGVIGIMTGIAHHTPLILLTLSTVVDGIERELLLKKQNRKLNILNQIMLSKTRNAIIITNTDGKVIEFNEFAEKIFGFKKEEIVGRSINDLTITGDFLKNILFSGKVYENIEMKFENNNNEKCVCLFDTQPIYDENSKVIGAFGQFRDITERYLAEEKYKNTEKEMSRLDRLNLIGQMAAGIGHEVRNPMTTVRGYLQLLGSKGEFAKYNGQFSLMIDELDRANSIITEFLSLAKDRVVDLKVQSLKEIVQNIFPLIQADGLISDKYIHMELEEVEEIPLDKKEIHQLILNLVLNGSQAMPSGGVVQISTFMDKEEIVLSVKDSGTGITPEVLRKIGTPFLTTKENGTGLGLAVCYSIAARHNAKIDIETGSKGTTFFVRFKR
ncbi:MAG: ATP-binding protein [Desulfosporosinus sp.]|nr:ATP-binding protein [Desulfosporosinus sp.]